MAKKTKRNVSISSSGQGSVPATYSRPSAGVTAPRTSYTQEFKPDYSIVVSDLKKIGVMAAAFTALLIVLSFFLR